MSSSIKLKNSSGKIVTITNPDTTSADVAVDLLNNAYTIATVDDFGTVPVGYTTVIVKDTDRGGVFNRIASTTANGGTIFDGTTGYSWEGQYSGAVNVKWFGAKGDEINDDTNSIKMCISVVAKNNGGSVFVPFGTYKTTETIYLKGISSIIGEGAIRINGTQFSSGASSFKAYHTGSAVISLKGASGIKLQGIAIEADLNNSP